MEIDLDLTEKSSKNTQRWWKLTATIDHITLIIEQQQLDSSPDLNKALVLTTPNAAPIKIHVNCLNSIGRFHFFSTMSL